jgi:glutamyl-tRNA reductase
MQRLLLLGLNHTTAPLEVRERLAFTAEQQRRAIELLQERFPGVEVVLLSTCNRVELYVAREVHGFPRIEQMAEFLAEFHQVPLGDFKDHLYDRSENAAIEHLFSVACSLNSMVLGESQILGQVRQAYDLSRVLGAAGSLLNPLFQRAIAVGKAVMHYTPLSDGHVSVAGVAVGYAKRIFDKFHDKTVLCIGAGKMSTLALKGFAALNPGKLLVCNRDAEKAVQIAGQFGGSGHSLDTLDTHLIAADIVITSTGATHPIITRSRFESLLKPRRYRPIFIIDIAVPRDVEAAVGELDHVYLYNVDDLQKAVAQTHNNRGQAVDAARAIVQQGLDEFTAWNRQRELGPTIDRLYKRLHEIANDEVARTIRKTPNLGEQEHAQLEELARRIVNKILHDPVTALRQSDPMHAPSGQYLHAIERMFRLEERDAEDPAEKKAD